MITTLIYAKMQLRIEEESANYFVARLTLAYELVISKTQKEGDEPKFVEAHLTDHHAVNVISQLRTTTVVAKLKAVLVSSNKLEIGEEEEVPQSLSQVYEPSQYPFPASLSDMSLNLSEDELEGVENRLLYDKEQDEVLSFVLFWKVLISCEYSLVLCEICLAFPFAETFVAQVRIVMMKGVFLVVYREHLLGAGCPGLLLTFSLPFEIDFDSF